MKRAVEHLRSGDPVMANIIGRVGPCRMKYLPPEFDTLVRSIVYQQVSGKAAATIYARLALAAGSSGVTARAILRLSTEELRAAGLSGQKTSYLKDLAEHATSGRLRFDTLTKLEDEDVIAALTAVKGIGVWTAQMFLMFALRRRDVLPVNDLGIRNAIRKEYGLNEGPSPAAIAEIAVPWRPWASVASWYLWRSLDGPAAL